MDYKIRTAVKTDLDQLVRIEQACFPRAEAASAEALKSRLELFSEQFLVAEQDGTLIGFINGSVSNRLTITDEMFENTGLHDPKGSVQAVFGLDVEPGYQGRGIGKALMRALIARAKDQGRKMMILTCKETLIAYYEQFGYVNKGVSESVHGGATWYDMTLELE